MSKLSCLLFLVFSLLTQPVFGLTSTQTPTPVATVVTTPTPTPPLGPGPIVSLWRALPNPVGNGSQQIRIANVGNTGTTLNDRSIYTVSSGKTIPLTGFLGPGENTFFNLPMGTLNSNGDKVKLIKGGAIYQGYFEGPVAQGRWVPFQWTSDTALSITATPTATPTPDGVRLMKILPDSIGDDDNSGDGEKIWIYNFSTQDISLEGWHIIDYEDSLQQDIHLSGTIPASSELEIVNESGDALFNNTTPDCIALIDAEGNLIDEGTYAVTGEGEETEILRPCP